MTRVVTRSSAIFYQARVGMVAKTASIRQGADHLGGRFPLRVQVRPHPFQATAHSGPWLF
jgi:hypothetical protein